ncbi:hypothetical protein MRX96_041821 [Rhipicephalus microplus]
MPHLPLRRDRSLLTPFLAAGASRSVGARNWPCYRTRECRRCGGVPRVEEKESAFPRPRLFRRGDHVPTTIALCTAFQRYGRFATTAQHPFTFPFDYWSFLIFLDRFCELRRASRAITLFPYATPSVVLSFELVEMVKVMTSGYAQGRGFVLQLF